ncbi:MAG: coproporphyrinogen-III oxidase family protein [Thiohalomonadales bacterium]
MDTQYWIERARQELRSMPIDRIQDSGILPDRGADFFPVIGYPPLTMFSDMNQDALFSKPTKHTTYPTLAYVHIPFCPSRCTFCHWITKTKSPTEAVDVYLDYLEREMILYKQQIGVDAIAVQSVLFGGGTPTYPSPRQMERLMKMFTTHFDLSSCSQFSVEAEPTTVIGSQGREKLQIMKDYGVDRISLGVQSFNDNVLAYMGRTHNHAQTLESIDNMRAVGIDNIFIDLIFGYPKQTLEMWTENMLECVALGIEGYQLYRLRIKQHGDRQGNILSQASKFPERFPDTDTVLLMKQIGILISEQHGYNEHQTRVFAKKANDISHYLRDWACHLADVIGVGVSAWSNFRGVFAINVGDANLQHYYDLIDKGKIAINRGKIRSNDDYLRRCLILPLKNLGVDKSLFLQRTGEDINERFGIEIAGLKTLGLLEEDQNRLWLTKSGRFFADEVATQFFNPEFMPFSDVTRLAQVNK